MDEKSNNMFLEKIISDIRRRKVIPVIGQGLYRVDIESENKGDTLLYDYLAEQILKECEGGGNACKDLKHKFAKACLIFLKENHDDYAQLSDFLKEKLKAVRLRPANSLWKLARIKSFNIFINSSFDNLLERTLKDNRFVPTKTLCYAKLEKYLNKLDNNLFSSIENFDCTLLYHIFGNFENIKPAYTENDLLESMMEFRKDMLENLHNNLFQKIASHSLLFIQCGFDDWLFRFFIRTMTGKSYDSFTKDPTFKLFTVDNFKDDLKYPQQELYHFLNYYGVDVFHANDGSDFVNMLYDKIEKDYPDEIIKPTVFISFEASDKASAQLLANNLREDGIDVCWEGSFGEGIGGPNKKIHQCSSCIPIISENSKRYQKNDETMKTFKNEWEQIYKDMKLGKTIILPVIIDNTTWEFERFHNQKHFRIPGGQRAEDYEDLKKRLLDIQQKN